MIVEVNEKQLSFLFQEKDSYFELGYFILEQAELSGMLPYKRMTQNHKEKLCFLTEGKKGLPDILPQLTPDEIIDVLYAVIHMTQKVEENGFMKKECIWCRYENIYYDTNEHKPLFAVLPITQEFRYADGASWQKGYEECLYQIAEYLPEKKTEQVKKWIKCAMSNQLETTELLEKMNTLGNGMSGLLVDPMRQEEEVENTKLELIYAGKEGSFRFLVEEKDFKIGRGAAENDGDLQVSKMVSRIHCMITKVNQKYFVQDLGGLNGTFVNEVQVSLYELLQLEQNDILRIADVDLRVNIIG